MTFNPSIAFDFHGNVDLNVAVSTFVSNGYIGASVGPTVEVTTADNIDELGGVEVFVGGSAGQEVVVGANIVIGETYKGVNVSASLGAGVSQVGPAEAHAGATAGANVFTGPSQRDWLPGNGEAAGPPGPQFGPAIDFETESCDPESYCH